MCHTISPVLRSVSTGDVQTLPVTLLVTDDKVRATVAVVVERTQNVFHYRYRRGPPRRGVVNRELSSSAHPSRTKIYCPACTTHRAISYFIRDSANESYKLVSIGSADDGESKPSRDPSVAIRRRDTAGRAPKAVAAPPCPIVIVILSPASFRRKHAGERVPRLINGSSNGERIEDVFHFHSGLFGSSLSAESSRTRETERRVCSTRGESARGEKSHRGAS